MVKKLWTNNYKILSICELNNILCIIFELCNLLSVDVESNIHDIYQEGYVARRDERRFHLPWNENVNHWLNITEHDLLRSEILNYFTKINDSSQFQVKTKIEGVYFYIE